MGDTMKKYRFNCFDAIIILSVLLTAFAASALSLAYQSTTKTVPIEYTLVIENAPDYLSDTFVCGEELYGAQGELIGRLTRVSMSDLSNGNGSIVLCVEADAVDKTDRLTVGKSSIAVGKSIKINTRTSKADALCVELKTETQEAAE